LDNRKNIIIIIIICYIFQDGKTPIVDRNCAQMSGQLKWSQELRMKMAFSCKKFKKLSHPVCFNPQAKEMFKKYKELQKDLDVYDLEVYDAWNSTIVDKVKDGLLKHLIRRDPESGALRVNFSNDLSSLLREVTTLKKQFQIWYGRNWHVISHHFEHLE
jgi:hypothetical protein